MPRPCPSNCCGGGPILLVGCCTFDQNETLTLTRNFDGATFPMTWGTFQNFDETYPYQNLEPCRYVDYEYGFLATIPDEGGAATPAGYVSLLMPAAGTTECRLAVLSRSDPVFQCTGVGYTGSVSQVIVDSCDPLHLRGGGSPGYTITRP